MQVVVEEEGYIVQSHVVNVYLLLSGMGESEGYVVGSVNMQRKKLKLNSSRVLQGLTLSH